MKNHEEESYLILLKDIIDNGHRRESRSGNTRSIFGTRLRFSLEGGKIPLFTTKKVWLKGIVEELLFFVRGDTDTKKLEAKGVNIWKGNTSRDFLDSRGLNHYPEGQMGPMYGFAWRHFGALTYMCKEGMVIDRDGADQLKEALRLIKEDPESRRIMVSAYNPNVSKRSVLDPCHLFFQFYVSGGKLSCQFMMRSVDCGLGIPYNLVSYAILTHMMAKASGLLPGELLFVGGDTHIYEDHVEALTEQMHRETYAFPTMTICKDISTVEDMEALSFEDFEIHDYESHPTIKMKMMI